MRGLAKRKKASFPRRGLNVGLISGDQYIKKENNTKGLLKGKVVDNQDPNRKGRVKCLIPGMIEGDTDKLPWCYPQTPNSVGGPTSGSFHVPKVGDELIITFPYEDKNMPVYVGSWQTETNHPIQFDEQDSYGQSGGTAFGDNSWVKVNEKDGTMEYKHPSGAFIFIDKDGSIFVNAKKHLSLYAPEGYLYLGGKQGVLLESEEGPVGIGSSQDMSIFSSGNIGLKAPGMIIRECKGVISDEATMVLHNCQIKDPTTIVTGSIIKKIGATCKSGCTGAGKKFDVVSQTSETKHSIISGITKGSGGQTA